MQTDHAGQRPAEHRGRRLRLSAAMLVVFLVLGVRATPAGAHAVLLNSTPEPDVVLDQAPAEVVLRFSEPISIPGDAIRVFDPSGRVVGDVDVTAEDDTMRAELPPLEADGSYTVAWKMVSADGHALRGAYLFHLRRATLTEPVDAAGADVATWPSAARAVGSALALGALAVVLGTAAFGAGQPRGSNRRRIAWGAATLGAASSALGSVAAAAGSSWLDGLDVSLSTSTGRVAAIALLVTLVGLAVSLWSPRRRVEQVIALVGVVAIALEGHAVALDPVLRSATLTVAHVLAAVTWGAGLLWLEQRTRVGSPEELRADVLRRSPWAAGAVVVLAATGVVLILDRVPLGELLSSWYGRLAIVKLALLGVAVILAARNRVSLAPALATELATEPTPVASGAAGPTGEPGVAAPGDGDAPVAGTPASAGPHGSTAALALLRTSVRIEMVVLAVALVVGAVLAQVAPPGKGPAGSGGPFQERASFGDGEVEITVDPGTRGMNEVHVTALGPDGRLMAEIDDLELSLTLDEEEVGPLTPEMQPVVPGHSVSYARFPFAGEWTVEVTATIDRFQALSATFTVPIGP